MSEAVSGRPAGADLSSARGMERVSAGLWLALAAAAAQFTAIASDFYVVGGENTRDAWFGIPHASELVLASALVTIIMAALAAGNRSPLSGRNAGLLIGVIGLLATAHIAYRMILPPFGGCLKFWDCTTAQVDVTLLPGIWIALVGSAGAALGGFIHAASGTARRTPVNFWVADRQAGMTPWLGVAAVSAVASLVIGYGGFTFYTVTTQGGGTATWSGWIATPHTSMIVLYMTLAVVGLVIAAARNRAPISPSALGATIAFVGFVGGFRIFYRILVPPFSSGPAEGVFQPGATIGIAAYVSLAAAILVVIAGIVQAVQSRGRERTAATPAAGQAATGTA